MTNAHTPPTEAELQEWEGLHEKWLPIFGGLEKFPWPLRANIQLVTEIRRLREDARVMADFITTYELTEDASGSCISCDNYWDVRFHRQGCFVEGIEQLVKKYRTKEQADDTKRA